MVTIRLRQITTEELMTKILPYASGVTPANSRTSRIKKAQKNCIDVNKYTD